MKERDWRIFKEDFQISTRGQGCPLPLRYWHESTIPTSILREIKTLGYKDPTPIQRAAITVGQSGRDLIGIAETGSGKTVSFLIPLFMHVMARPKITTELIENGIKHCLL